MRRRAPAVEVRLLREGEEPILRRCAPGVFDRAVNPRWSRELLADPRHRLAVAVDVAAATVVGMASGVAYLNPDKPPELWINEVGVAPTHRRRGLARRLLETLLREGRRRGCAQAWVLTSRGNAAAMGLYARARGRAAAGDQVMFEFPLAAPLRPRRRSRRS